MCAKIKNEKMTDKNYQNNKGGVSHHTAYCNHQKAWTQGKINHTL